MLLCPYDLAAESFVKMVWFGKIIWRRPTKYMASRDDVESGKSSDPIRRRSRQESRTDA